MGIVKEYGQEGQYGLFFANCEVLRSTIGRSWRQRGSIVERLEVSVRSVPNELSPLCLEIATLSSSPSCPTYTNRS